LSQNEFRIFDNFPAVIEFGEKELSMTKDIEFELRSESCLFVFFVHVHWEYAQQTFRALVYVSRSRPIKCIMSVILELFDVDEIECLWDHIIPDRWDDEGSWENRTEIFDICRSKRGYKYDCSEDLFFDRIS